MVTQEEREQIARNIERAFKRAASSLRDCIIEGDSFEEACKKQEFWTQAVEREAKKLEA